MTVLPPSAQPEPRVVAVFGPTGVGKTPVAVRIAAALGVRVISCDSMQLYRGFPVLTNQPSPDELARAPHELVAVTAPDEEWNAAIYAQHAQPLVDEDVARKGRAVLAGGTGLYLRAALAPLAIPNVHDPELRASLTERGAREGSEILHAELAARDPGAASGIHPRNLRRVVRALEVVLVQGPGAWSGRSDLWEPAYRHPTLIVGLVREREELYRCINERARGMLDEGAIEEVRRHLEARGLLQGGEADPCGGESVGVAKAIGYREVCRLLSGESTREEAVERLAAATRRYARGQLTWLRKLKDAVIMDVSPGPEAVAGEIVRLVRG